MYSNIFSWEKIFVSLFEKQFTVSLGANNMDLDKGLEYFCSFVREIHWWPVDSPHKGPVMFQTSKDDEGICSG